MITFVIVNKIDVPYDFYIYSKAKGTSNILGSERCVTSYSGKL